MDSYAGFALGKAFETEPENVVGPKYLNPVAISTKRTPKPTATTKIFRVRKKLGVAAMDAPIFYGSGRSDSAGSTSVSSEASVDADATATFSAAIVTSPTNL